LLRGGVKLTTFYLYETLIIHKKIEEKMKGNKMQITRHQSPTFGCVKCTEAVQLLVERGVPQKKANSYAKMVLNNDYSTNHEISASYLLRIVKRNLETIASNVKKHFSQ